MTRAEETVVAVTWSLYKLHPTLSLRLENYTDRLTNLPFSYQLSEDGSGRGVDLVAAIATRLAISEC